MADVTDATFETDVLERSKTVPVVIDLWAPWCGPCQTLGPILEKVIGETQGLVELAKVDVDENPGVGQAFQVQSIPAVYAMVDGQVVDGFMGAKGEPEVVEFIQNLLNLGADAGTVQDGAVQGSAVQDGAVQGGVEGEGIAAGENGAAAGEASASAAAAPAAAAAAAAITPDAVISEPGMAPMPVGQPAPSAAEADAIEGQLNDLLTKVKGDDEVREQYLALLEKLGAEDPRKNSYRRKLATALY